MIAINYNQADKFVTKLQKKGVEVIWRGWDMVFFKPDHRAVRSPSGRRRGDTWGFETIVSPDTKTGKWMINYRLARGANA